MVREGRLHEDMWERLQNLSVHALMTDNSRDKLRALRYAVGAHITNGVNPSKPLKRLQELKKAHPEITGPHAVQTNLFQGA